MRLRVVFVSHGAPDALLSAPEAVAAWQAIGWRTRARRRSDAQVFNRMAWPSAAAR